MYARYIDISYNAQDMLDLASQELKPWRKFKNVLGEEKDFYEQGGDHNHPLIKDIFRQLGTNTIVNCFFNKIPVGFQLPIHTDVIRNTTLIIPLTHGHEPIVFWDAEKEDANKVAEFEYTKPLLVNVKQPHNVPAPKHNDRISFQVTLEEKFADVRL